MIVLAVAGAVIIALATVNASASGAGHDATSKLNLIAPADAGGGWDGAAREAQQAMRSAGIVNNAQVVNIPGAGGTIGLNQLAGMRGENTTLMVMGITMLGAININGSSTDLDDVTPIARLTEDYDVLVVPADAPYDSVDDLLAEWKKNPREFAVGGGSLGGLDQMIAAQLAGDGGIDPTDVNYIAYSGGAELATSLLSGTIKASVSGYADFEAQIESGSLKALAVSAPQPVPSIDLPTLKQEGYDIELTNWRGVFAPPGLSADDEEKLGQIVEETVSTPEWQDAIKRNRWVDRYAGQDEFAEYVDSETEAVNEIWADLGY